MKHYFAIVFCALLIPSLGHAGFPDSTLKQEKAFIETLKTTSPYDKLLTIDVCKDTKADVDETESKVLYCGSVQYLSGIKATKEDKEEISAALVKIRKYSGDIAGVVLGAKSAEADDINPFYSAYNFKLWLTKNISFIEKLSCITDIEPFGPYDFTRSESIETTDVKLIEQRLSSFVPFANVVKSSNDENEENNSLKPLTTTLNTTEKEKQLAISKAVKVLSSCKEQLSSKDGDKAAPSYYTSLAGSFLERFTAVEGFNNWSLEDDYLQESSIKNKSRALCSGLVTHAIYRAKQAKKQHEKIQITNKEDAKKVAKTVNNLINDINKLCKAAQPDGTKIKNTVNQQAWNEADFEPTPEGPIIAKGATWSGADIKKEITSLLKQYEEDPQSTYSKQIKLAHAMYIALFSAKNIFIPNRELTAEEESLLKKDSVSYEDLVTLQKLGKYIENPMSRLITAPAFQEIVGLSTLNKENFLYTCLIEGKPFPDFQYNDDPLDEKNKIVTGNLIIKSEKQVASKIDEAIKEHYDNAKICIHGTDYDPPTTTVKQTLPDAPFEDASYLTDQQVKHFDEKFQAANDQKYQNMLDDDKKRNEVIVKYINSSPLLFMDYVANVKDASYTGICPAFIQAYDKQETNKTINGVITAVSIPLFILSFGEAQWAITEVRGGLIAIGILDGYLSITNILDTNDELDFINLSMASGFISPADGATVISYLKDNRFESYLSLGWDVFLVGTSLRSYIKFKKPNLTVPVDANGNPIPVTVVEEAGQTAIDFSGTGRSAEKYAYTKTSPTTIARHKIKVIKKLKKILPDKMVKGADGKYTTLAEAWGEALGTSSAKISNLFKEMAMCKEKYPKTDKAIRNTIAVDLSVRLSGTFFGYLTNLGDKEFEWRNVGSDAIATVGKGVLVPIMGMRALDKNKTVLGFWPRVWKAYPTGLKWGAFSELVSSSVYYFTGGADAEYGEDAKSAIASRAAFGLVWTGPSILLKMTLYDLVMGFTCIVPGMKVFARMKSGVMTAIEFVPPIIAQGTYSLGTSYLFYLGRSGFMHATENYSKSEKSKIKSFEEIKPTDKDDFLDVDNADIQKINFEFNSKDIEDDLKDSERIEISPL